MKRAFTTLSVIVLIIFAACKKSSSPIPSSASSTDSSLILGKWTLVSEVEAWYSLNGNFSDSSHFPVTAQDTYDFEKGVVYTSYLHSSGLVLDTSSYNIVNNQYLAVYNPTDGADTAKITISHDTLTMTSVSYNTVDLNGNPANGYDTAVLIKN